MQSTLKLRKIKRPAGVGYFDVLYLTEDEFGVWLYGPAGSTWEAPHDRGKLPFDFVALVNPNNWWVAWWVDDPKDKRLEIDVCLPPQREDDGWSYVDLELDPIRHESGLVEIQDRDEFEDACQRGWITPENAKAANATAEAMEMWLSRRDEPLGQEGWKKLRALKGTNVR